MLLGNVSVAQFALVRAVLSCERCVIIYVYTPVRFVLKRDMLSNEGCGESIGLYLHSALVRAALLGGRHRAVCTWYQRDVAASDHACFRGSSL